MPTIRGKLRDGRFPVLRVVISNDLGLPPIDDMGPQTLVPQEEVVLALIDTGATTSMLSHDLCDRLRLEQAGLKEFLFANAPHAEVMTTHAGTLFLHEEVGGAGRRHEWPDIVTFGRMNLGTRLYQAVLGMDVITGGELRLQSGHAITFDF